MTEHAPAVPAYWQYMNPILGALRDLGGSATIQEMYEKVTSDMGLSEDQLGIMHDPDRGTQSEADYRMAWARSYLKKVGLVDNSRRGVWTLTPEGARAGRVDPQEVVRTVRARYAQGGSRVRQRGCEAGELDDEQPVDAALDEQAAQRDWRERLLDVLRTMAPDAFERLCQRLLRENGFVEVKVTGRSGDGGIDGVGLLRLQGMLSFRVIFQCKRVTGSVPSSQIRDFRGAMVGRADKGLFITTGTFAQPAVAEATRDGAPAIDLIDGDQLVELLKKLELGVRTEVVEHVVVDEEWFLSL